MAQLTPVVLRGPAAVLRRVMVLPRSPLVSGAAGDAMREHADERGPERTGDAFLLVSELATNASVLGSLLLSEFPRGGTRPIAVRARSALATTAESGAICSVLSSAR